MKLNGTPEEIILAADVGGTNASVALVGRHGSDYEKLFERRYSTKAEPSLEEPLSRFLAEAKAAGQPVPQLLCVSGAGPVKDGAIKLTNAPWGIDRRSLESRFGLPSFVINDFSAIAWGLLLLDPANPAELLPLPKPDGALAEASPDGVVAVLGAGTGLGFGFVTREGDRPRVYPSEGGHIGLPVYDDDTRALSRALAGRYGFAVGAEAAVSGPGIGNVFRHLASLKADPGPALRSILDAPEAEWPALVAAAADSEPVCAKTMDMFVRLYARVAADMASAFLPSGGIYLAGGIAAKNERWFTEGSRFMDSFLKGYREHVRAIAARTPVYIVRDYAISIYGAAHAAATMAR